MALLTAPAPARTVQRPPAARVGRGRRLVARARSTPGRLTSLTLALLAIGLATGVAGLVGSVQRSSLVDEVRTRSGPLAVQAQELYRSLSDADAAAASGFLSGGVEPPPPRDRYQADIAAAAAALAAAYLGEASGLMRGQLLPAAQQLYRFETDRLAADRGGASAVPWLALLLGLVTLAGLVWAQLRLSRQTHRTLNVGLVAATLAGLVMVSWVGTAWVAAASQLHASNREGSAQVELLAGARIAALQARADEALTLVARGTGEVFEKDFTAQLTTLTGPGGTSGVLSRARAAATDPAVRSVLDSAVAEVRSWHTVHQKLRELDDGGSYGEAVKLAIDADTGSTASIFNRVDAALGKTITLTSSAFDRRAARAAGALGGESAAIVVLTILLLAGVAVGFQQRIAEYR